MGCYESDCFDNETRYEKQLFHEDNFCSCLHQLKKKYNGLPKWIHYFLMSIGFVS